MVVGAAESAKALRAIAAAAAAAAGPNVRTWFRDDNGPRPSLSGTARPQNLSRAQNPCTMFPYQFSPSEDWLKMRRSVISSASLSSENEPELVGR
eukprot:636838-Prorocentrum_minimum.AAC.1